MKKLVVKNEEVPRFEVVNNPAPACQAGGNVVVLLARVSVYESSFLICSAR